ncbi:DUF885 family protein [uncultured Microscilla sp.]|uniref:DUF885 domain-containing protein n=1 Tax=uncultured Microscilla sp. TaxID=432653 RepID=UPI0026031234|nr:DUF885 domain-containing protein [uncultured Microscilla sp.]
MKHPLPVLILSFCCTWFSVSCQTLSQKQNMTITLKKIFQTYTDQCSKLGIRRGFNFSYQADLRNIPTMIQLKKRQAFFELYAAKIAQVQRAKLAQNEQYDYDHFAYELKKNREELDLQLAFIRQYKNQPIPDQGLSFLPKTWYSLYVKRMTTAEISPEAIMEFGKKEVARVKSNIRRIQAKAGYEGRDQAFYQYLQSPQFQLTNLDTILARYARIDRTVRQHLHKVFAFTAPPKVKISPIPNANYDTPPGYLQPNQVSGNTFFFKFYQNKHNWRGMDFLYIHEALPGHSYHFDWENLHLKNRPAFHSLISYPGYFEGWAAYCENFGKELGLYQNIYTEFGKWSWDLVRSVRVVLDAGIHAKGWSKQQALTYWQKHLPFRMDIAQREVDRVMRWPAQVLSYKLGEAKLLELKRKCEKALGASFDIKKFHSLVLSKGQIPLQLMETMVNDFIKKYQAYRQSPDKD